MSDEVPDAGPYEPPVTVAGTGCETVPETAEEAAAEPAGPLPLGVVRTPTGHAAVDAHLGRLADADHLTADGHLQVYEDVHKGLRSALTALDAPPVPGPYENRS
ncbi:hypothetical protein [Streptomyces sp. NBC_01408]|uniref:hypothetical protein n=1 Tax=Streptomyces sp. NBC_01408 TaxID=2903855 RepID=UPI0022575F54|nr:hypothetical protein [Streptomyces sp. NBC_01408]MCX4694119.1 hypothetical protein [Streptomyces sp. NBC_01408]